MNLSLMIAVGLMGGIGAVARFLLDRSVSLRFRGGLPYGTLAVNLSGAFLLGLLWGAAAGEGPLRLAGLGLLGSFTTFSTLAYESHRLAEAGRYAAGFGNLGLSVGAGLIAFLAGYLIGAPLA
jgi:fluoride exporter